VYHKFGGKTDIFHKGSPIVMDFCVFGVLERYYMTRGIFFLVVGLKNSAFIVFRILT